MVDWSQVRDLIWEARWDAIVMVGRALWVDIVSFWWFGPLLLIVLLAAGRKAWLRLIRFVGVTFVRGGTRD